jgi:O-antigen/teichoic acid export membrane protein
MLRTPSSLSGRRRLIANAGSLAVGGILAQAAFLSVEALIARDIGASAYGIFSAVYALTLLMTLAIDMGMNWKLIEEGARDSSTLPVNLGSMLSLKLLIAALVYPLTLAAFRISGYDSPLVELYVMFIPFALLMLVQESLAAVYTATRSNWFNALFQTAVPLTILVAVVVIVRPQPSLARASVAYTLGSAIPTLLWLFIAWRAIGARVEVSRFASIIRGSYLYGMNALVSYGSFKSGVLLLAALSSARDVAYFAAAFKFVDIGYKIPIVANRLFAPQLFADSKHRPEEFSKLCDVLLRVAALMGAVAAAVLLMLGEDLIVLIFGREFAMATALVQMLGVSLALKTFALIAANVITSAGHLAFRTRAMTAATIAGVIVSVPLILAWGARGAAVGVLVADVTFLLALLWRLRGVLSVPRIATIAGAPLVATTVAVWFGAYTQFPHIYEGVAGVAIVVAALFLLGYLRPVLRLALQSGEPGSTPAPKLP